jgi:hypothetical protein
VHRHAHTVLQGHPPQLARYHAFNALPGSSTICLEIVAVTAFWDRIQVRLERQRAHPVVLAIPPRMEQPHAFPVQLVSTTLHLGHLILLLDPLASTALRGHIQI